MLTMAAYKIHAHDGIEAGIKWSTHMQRRDENEKQNGSNQRQR